jgi:hypothetical protein
MFKDDKHPTGEELYALELWARHERDLALARSFAAGASAARALFARAFSLLRPSAHRAGKHTVHHA